MRKSSMLKTGVIGTVVTAVCCFTPVLVWFVSAVGLGSLIPLLDIVLLPMLGCFIALTLYAFVQSGNKPSR